MCVCMCMCEYVCASARARASFTQIPRSTERKTERRTNTKRVRRTPIPREDERHSQTHTEDRPTGTHIFIDIKAHYFIALIVSSIPDVDLQLVANSFDANVRLDKNSVKIDNTYITMANQKTVTIVNRSDTIAK